MSALLAIRSLRVGFETHAGLGVAIEDVSLSIAPGETLAVVGESGCGKSVTAMTILRLLPSPPARILGGEILFGGHDLLKLEPEAMREIRGRDIAMIFQEPMTSLNPVYTVGGQIVEAIRAHRSLSTRSARARAAELLRLVRIPDPDKRFHDYPHRLSGGMRQRVMIAMALACDPKLLIADEPTTALDVTVQAQILELVGSIQRELGMGLLLITHNLGVVAEIASRVVVMYAGRIVEEGAVRDVLARPRHPYTEGLLGATPRPPTLSHHGRDKLREIPGLVPSLFEAKPGCAFAPRCPKRLARCERERPEMRMAGAQAAACFALEASS